MIRTSKTAHNHDLSRELSLALRVAQFVVQADQKYLTSKDVCHFGLKSAISNQIIRKYKRSKVGKVKSCPLVIPGQAIKWTPGDSFISVTPLRKRFRFEPQHEVIKINSCEIGPDWVAISYTSPDVPTKPVNGFCGVDLNEAGHIAVVADSTSGKVLKLGKDNRHRRQAKLKARSKQQSKGQYRKVKKSKEHRWSKDRSHKLAKQIVDFAIKHEVGIRMEDLTGIRKAKGSKSQRRRNGGWPFYMLRILVQQKAEAAGIPFELVDPKYTSKACSRCGELGNRAAKMFNCSKCGHFDHADVNAGFNIANIELMNAARKRLAVTGASSNAEDLIPRESSGIKPMPTLEPTLL